MPDSIKPLWNEQDRLRALESYDILDTPKEEEFEEIVKMAAEACNVPVSLISLVTSNRQWFKAEVGTGLIETPLGSSICSHAILQKDLFVVPDTTKDSRFKENPLVWDNPNFRFYAGALLESPEGLPLGTICVLDYKPRLLTEKEGKALKALAKHVMLILDLRRTTTSLRRALAEKSQSEERLSLALNVSGFVGIWEWDIVKDRVFADPKFVSTFGGEPHWSVEGAPLAEYTKAIHPDDLPRVTANIEKALKPPGNIFLEEYRLRQRDGSIRWIQARGQCQFDDAEQPVRFPGVAIDITERKAMDQKEREAAERFQFMAESMPQKIWTATPNGSIDFFNRQWMEFTGLSYEHIRDWGWKQFVHPDDLDETLGVFGSAIQAVKPFELQQRLRRADGTYRWHLARGAPMFNTSGDVIMWIGSNTDITDLLEAQNALKDAHNLVSDRAALLETVVQQRTQKLTEAVDELQAFSYSISHDLRAPLRSMIGFSTALNEEYAGKLDASGIDFLKRIAVAGRRMDQLIQDVLVFSRVSREDVGLEPIDTDALIHELIESYPNLRDEIVSIVIPSPLPSVRGNKALLTQCFANILGNASKFVTEGTKPCVEMTAKLSPGRVRLFFRDNGIGMSEHSLERIFQIFQQVGRGGDGTGIGLAIVRKAVEKMDGTVGVDSELGKGSTFWLDLGAA